MIEHTVTERSGLFHFFFTELLMLVQCQGPTDVSSEQITQSKEAVLYVNKVTVPETNGDAITQCNFQ